MSGIIFLKTQNKGKIVNFYSNQIGMDIWLKQKDCVILKHGNLLLGFCSREKTDTQGMITFFYQDKGKIDELYNKFKDIANTEPKENDKYNIYHFFAKDPENRTIEFQHFLHHMDSYLTGDELLLTRRSVRYFKNKKIPDDILWRLLEIMRFCPTSKNSQSYYLVIIKDRKKIEQLASLREESSEPIGQAPMAVAICSDPLLSKRHVQDGCIAAYHLTLAAWNFGLGTCWIGGMDRKEVKRLLEIPEEHYVTTVTPLGYPSEKPEIRPRREAKEFVKFVK